MTFDYVEPRSLDEATGLLAQYADEGVALAGGTAIVLLLKQGLIRPAHIVGLRRLVELRGIRADAEGLWIGALLTHREVERSAEVRAHHHALADTFAMIATVRIRNQATLGGNLAHADPAQDPPPMLMTLDASAVVAGAGGARREIPLDGFFVDHLTTVLAPGEIVLGVRVPPVGPATRATYVKFLPRTADDYATVSVAAAMRLRADGTIDHVRVTLGSVGPTPLRARRVEDALRGERPTPERLRDAAALVRDEIDPLDDARGTAQYKREMARVWTERALLRLTA